MGNTLRVVIVGAGFGGLYAARALADRPVRVTVIDRVNYHTFQPLLYQVATGVLSPGEIAQPIRRILSRAKNIQVLMAEVDGFDLDSRRVVLKGGTPVEYDYLVISGGSRHSYFGHDEWELNAPGLKTIDDAIAIRVRLLKTFEEQERRAYLGESAGPVHFAVIGGGTTGVELAGAIADIATRALGRDYRRFSPLETRVSVFEGAPRILKDYPGDLSRRATEQLRELGVEVRTDSMVTGVRPGAIQVRGEWIPVNAALWATGVAASPLGKLLNVPVDKFGRVAVNVDLSLPARPEVFVIGDMASVTDAAGVHVPGLAAVATQEGRAAAHNILLDAQGKKRRGFRYHDRGTLATIGRNRAVAVIFGRHLSGLPAWLLWAFVHIFLLIGFRNRLAVFVDWMWAYFTRQRSSLLITAKDEEGRQIMKKEQSEDVVHKKPVGKIVVIGGTGLIGTKLVNKLRRGGYEVVPAAPSSGVDTITGEGLAQALAGAQVVVDVSNAPSWEDNAVMSFFETSGRNLLAAEAAAGVGHHVALSVVGTDRLLASGYFRAKMTQEKLIKASPIPYTIVRATQFFEFVGGIAQFATEGTTVRVPPVLMQPIAAEEVAAFLADAALAQPLNGTFEVAGPEPIHQDDLVRQFLSATGDTRTLIADPKALYYGIAVNDRSLMPGDNPRLGTIRFEDWLRRSQAPQARAA